MPILNNEQSEADFASFLRQFYAAKGCTDIEVKLGAQGELEVTMLKPGDKEKTTLGYEQIA